MAGGGPIYQNAERPLSEKTNLEQSQDDPLDPAVVPSPGRDTSRDSAERREHEVGSATRKVAMGAPRESPREGRHLKG